MSFRIALYGEGGGDVPRTLSHGPSTTLTADEEGPAHILVRRIAAQMRAMPDAAVSFRAPYLNRNRHYVGSELLDAGLRERIESLHATFPERIDAVVLLVDRDGDTTRIPTRKGPVIFAVAREEFESWLLSDPVAVQTRLGASPPANVEHLPPTEAKRWLRSQIAAQKATAREAEFGIRCDLARQADLRTAMSNSSSLDALAHALA